MPIPKKVFTEQSNLNVMKSQLTQAKYDLQDVDKNVNQQKLT